MLKERLVLIVDDDRDLREELVNFLNGYGVKTEDAGNAADAKKIMHEKQISLVVADIVMPGESGLELTKWVMANKNIPVILLTSLDDVVDRVTGLEIGADDYVPKPFDPRELLARVKSVLRRSANFKVIDDTNTDKHLFTLNNHDELSGAPGVIQKLRAAEANLLRVLVKNQGTPVSRAQLYSEVLEKNWNPEDRSIDNMIVRLRNLLEIDSSNPKIISTVRQKGYVITNGTVKTLET